MDTSDTLNPNYSDPSVEQLPPEEPELSHTDKITGILSEPAKTYESVAKFPLRTIDWLLPILILCFVVAITNIVMLSNPEIKLQVQEKQTEQMRKNFDQAVKEGRMTREQADQQMAQMEEGMKSMGMAVQIVISTISIFILGFIFFFLISLIYFVFARFILKGTGTYTSVLVASGLTAYITIIQVVIAAILAIALGRLLNDTSLASILNMDKTSYVGWVAAKIDPITIWAYSILSIGLAKLFRSESTTKYFIMVFGLWIVGTFLLFLIAKAVPFLSFLIGA